MVTEPTRNDGVVHDRLVGLVLEVRLPSLGEVGGRPGLELLKLLGSRADLHASLDTVRRQGAGAVQLPLVEDLCYLSASTHSHTRRRKMLTLLDFRDAPHEVVETLGAGLGTVRREGEVVVLEVETNTRKVDLGLDTRGPELGGVADTRSLEDQRGGERAAGNNDLLAGPEDARLQLVRVKRLGGAVIR